MSTFLRFEFRGLFLLILLPLLASGTNLKYIGCYDVWENLTSDLLTDHFMRVENKVSECAKDCKILAELGRESREYAVLVRGFECRCPFLNKFAHVRVANGYCPRFCEDGSNTLATCGGSYTFSGYCLSNSENCTNFVPPPKRKLYHRLKNSNDENQISINDSNKISNEVSLNSILKRCVNCTNCRGQVTPRFDYMPDLTVGKCIWFCRRQIHYQNARGIPRIREPMKFALTGWMNKTSLLPACACSTSIDEFEFQPPRLCNRPCPGNPLQDCGSEFSFIFNAYLSQLKTV